MVKAANEVVLYLEPITENLRNIKTIIGLTERYLNSDVVKNDELIGQLALSEIADLSQVVDSFLERIGETLEAAKRKVAADLYLKPRYFIFDEHNKIEEIDAEKAETLGIRDPWDDYQPKKINVSTEDDMPDQNELEITF